MAKKTYKEWVTEAVALERSAEWTKASAAWDEARKASKDATTRAWAKGKVASALVNAAEFEAPESAQPAATVPAPELTIAPDGKVTVAQVVDPEEVLGPGEVLRYEGGQFVKRQASPVVAAALAAETPKVTEAAAVAGETQVTETPAAAGGEETDMMTKKKAAKKAAASKAPKAKTENQAAAEGDLVKKERARAKAAGLKYGTVLEHKQRGKVIAKCTYVGDRQWRYAGKDYTSNSAAANACAEHLKMKSRSLNGWLFWGIETREGDK